MGQTDKQFGGFLRMLIARMKGAVDALEKGGQQDEGVLLERKKEVLMRLEEIELLQELNHGIR